MRNRDPDRDPGLLKPAGLTLLAVPFFLGYHEGLDITLTSYSVLKSIRKRTRKLQPEESHLFEQTQQPVNLKSPGKARIRMDGKERHIETVVGVQKGTIHLAIIMNGDQHVLLAS
ncbi:hypothetical protein O3P69_001082 [Scylla paramamosain]|uniref:Uncharacterized protein n=1 Tax=Scylla paramamosain TaxID=85552 RepID=A0AAW0UNH9_SCYPA